MPTVLRAGRFVVKMWGPPREHAPAHAHVYVGRDGVVVVRLSIGDRPCAVWRVEGQVSGRDVVEAVRLVEDNEPALCAAWRRIHGT